MNTLPLPPFDLPVTPEDRMLASTLTGGRTDAEITRSAQYIRQYVNAEKAALFIDKRTYIELAAEECGEKNRLIGVLTALYDAGHWRAVEVPYEKQIELWDAAKAALGR